MFFFGQEKAGFFSNFAHKKIYYLFVWIFQICHIFLKH